MYVIVSCQYVMSSCHVVLSYTQKQTKRENLRQKKRKKGAGGLNVNDFVRG